MNNIINWIIDNKEWVFSGIGIALVGLLLRIVCHFISRKNNINVKQTSKNGDITQIAIQNNYYSEGTSEPGNQSNTECRN